MGSYEGTALENQTVEPRTTEEVMVGGLVKVSAEDAAANLLRLAQSKRRNAAACTSSVYRSKSGKAQIEDADDEEEIEIAVDGEFQGADPEAGCRAGFAVYGASRIDNGEEIELTEEEKSEIEIDQDMDACDRAEEAMYEERESD